MTEFEEATTKGGEGDPVVTALTTLSHVATSSANELLGLNQDLTQIRDHRLEGWSWRRIMDDNEAKKPLSAITEIATNFARASGGFRRALATGLRGEGLQVTEVAALFDVSRQRVSALLRPRDPHESEQLVD
jgi:hypothetical protein